NGQVYVGGSVQGGGFPQESASSQILYGAAGAFTLRFSETAPDAVGSSDLQLFDFFVDAPAVLGSGNVIDNPAILIDEGSITRAGNVSIISDVAQTTAQLSPEILIRSSIEATSGDRTGSFCSVEFCPALIIDSRNEGRVRFDRPRSQGETGGQVLGDLVAISSGGSIDVIGASILSLGDLDPDSDYETVRFSGATRLFGRYLVALHNAGLNGASVVAHSVDLINTYLDPLGGDIFGDVVSISGNQNAGSAPDLTFGNIFAESGSVTVDTRGGFRAGDVHAAGQSLARVAQGSSQRRGRQARAVQLLRSCRREAQRVRRDVQKLGRWLPDLFCRSRAKFTLKWVYWGHGHHRHRQEGRHLPHAEGFLGLLHPLPAGAGSP
ncbi:MAG: hypothetical protein EBZ36_17975, partial [Acidobacteria bacterium]|nr:hypothetical protein [Acidobacteriota bacterium]